MRVRAWGAAAAVALGGCAAEPSAPSTYEPVSPPATYRDWFGKTEACSGLSGDFDRIRWYVVPGSEFACPSGACAARWIDDHRIFVAQAYLANELVVRHEMLHDLIGHAGHPDPPFGSSGCGLTWSSWSGRLVPLPGSRID
ncbi:MAG TPA: hypothetical protein VFU46_00880 [Gemmatimonadales bacterium]|nr:hypothetical protein [Gemmatimonadales bacterium]